MDGPTGRSGQTRTLELARPDWPRLAGRTLVVVGGLMVAFAAFQLWGTAIIEWQAQRSMSSELQARSVALPAPGADTAVGADELIGNGPLPAPLAPVGGATNRPAPSPGPLVPEPSTSSVPAVGEPVGRIEIPAIGLSKALAEGVDRDTLRHGPGHYPATPLPGHPGNTAIAGHRTTHGAPFYHLDELVPGDDVMVTTAEGEFHYVVVGQTGAGRPEIGYRIVEPDAVDVLADQGDNRLTLTACHPRYSARQRIVVTAELVGPALAHDPGPEPAPGQPRDGATSTDPVMAGSVRPDPAGGAGSSNETVVTASGADRSPSLLSGSSDALAPTILWATVCALVAHGAWILSRMGRRWAWVAGAVGIAPCLFVCFAHLDRLLPAF